MQRAAVVLALACGCEPAPQTQPPEAHGIIKQANSQPVERHLNGAAVCLDLGDKGIQLTGSRWVVPEGEPRCEPPVVRHTNGAPVCVNEHTPPPGFDSCLPALDVLIAKADDKLPKIPEADASAALLRALSTKDWGAAAVSRLDLAAVAQGHAAICASAGPVRTGLAGEAEDRAAEAAAKAKKDSADRQAWIAEQTALQDGGDPMDQLARFGVRIRRGLNRVQVIALGPPTAKSIIDSGHVLEAIQDENPDGYRARIAEWARRTGVDPASVFPGRSTGVVLRCIDLLRAIHAYPEEQQARETWTSELEALCLNGTPVCPVS